MLIGRRFARSPRPNRVTRLPLVWAGVVLGLGTGAIVKATVLHRMLTPGGEPFSALPATLPNVAADPAGGVLHAVAWAVTASGLWLVFRTAHREDVAWSDGILGGALAIGLGLFVLLESVYPGVTHGLRSPEWTADSWDRALLGLGLLLAAGGMLAIGGLVNATRSSSSAPPGAHAGSRSAT